MGWRNGQSRSQSKSAEFLSVCRLRGEIGWHGWVLPDFRVVRRKADEEGMDTMAPPPAYCSWLMVRGLGRCLLDCAVWLMLTFVSSSPGHACYSSSCWAAMLAFTFSCFGVSAGLFAILSQRVVSISLQLGSSFLTRLSMSIMSHRMLLLLDRVQNRSCS